MLTSYFTVKKYGETEIIIQKSRFIGYVQRVETEEEAQEFVRKINKKHHDATHNCFAYVIGDHDQIQKANDDGEPSGTAGIPILEVIKRQNLKNTAVVVTRYFGGIKLGAGGLIRAYGRSTTEGINAAGVVERRLVTVMHTKIDYTWLGKVENEMRSSHYLIKDIHYLEDVEIETYVEEENVKAFSDWITEMTNGQAIIKEGKQLYLERDI